MDEPADIRYNHIFEHFKEPLLQMEHFWYSQIPAASRSIIETNLDIYATAQPENYAAMQSLADMLGLPASQTVLVNMIVERATFCTSIVARNHETNEIVHVRNLDFGNTENMTQLVYEGVFIKNGVEKARCPLIAGFLGAYTGRNAHFSISYNVRESTAYSETAQLDANFQRNLSPFHMPA